jgi:N-acetylmuramoyl-L-alanine amidase
MANESSAQLMVSIHRNKAQGEGNGVEIFIPLGDSTETKLLAENIMKALVSQGFEERSIRAGTLMSSEEDYEEMATAVMPRCLVEVGFISDDKDNEIFDNKMKGNAKAMSKAITETFAQLYESVEDEDL